jgi:hypothetical protein
VQLQEIVIIYGGVDRVVWPVRWGLRGGGFTPLLKAFQDQAPRNELVLHFSELIYFTAELGTGEIRRFSLHECKYCKRGSFN